MPWCVRKCPYCDFNSHQLKSAQPDACVHRCADSRLRSGAAARWRAAGSTRYSSAAARPACFLPKISARLLGELRRRIAFAEDAEITLEANPGTIERGRFAGYRDAGINRVSLGAQTFAPRALEALGRIHTGEDTHRAVAELRAAQLDNFNLDLMYALPRQTLRGGARRCQRLRARSSPRIFPTTSSRSSRARCFTRGRRRCRTRMRPGRCKLRARNCWRTQGYVQYEVSAYARAGARCRHNLNYWLFGDYLGIGAGAHGKLSLRAAAAHLAHHEAQTAARISGTGAPRGEARAGHGGRQHRR